MNVYQTVNISTNIHNERIKTKYIPSYIFENKGKILPKLNEFHENLRCSNINGALHKLLIGECLTRAKSVCKQTCFGLYVYTKTRTFASVNTRKRSF